MFRSSRWGERRRRAPANPACTPDASPGTEPPPSNLALPGEACGGSLPSQASQAAAPTAPVERQDRQERSKFTQAAPPSVSFTSGSHLIKPHPPRPTAHPTLHPTLLPSALARRPHRRVVENERSRGRQVASWRCPHTPTWASPGPQTSPMLVGRLWSPRVKLRHC